MGFPFKNHKPFFCANNFDTKAGRHEGTKKELKSNLMNLLNFLKFSLRLKSLVDTGLETGANGILIGKCFQPFELIEPFERIEHHKPLQPHKPHKPHKPLKPLKPLYPSHIPHNLFPKLTGF